MRSASLLTDTDQRAAAKLDRFVERFSPAYRLLVYYAALPLVLTPELVNYLRVQFLRSEGLDWVAEVDLLLSDLCRPVGYELYALDADVRALALREGEAQLSEAQLRAAAQALLSYVQFLARNPQANRQQLQAQRWGALLYLQERREGVVGELAEAFQVAGGAGDAVGTDLLARSELARLVRLVAEEFAPQLQEFPLLLEHARVVSDLLRQPEMVKAADLRPRPVAGVTLLPPAGLLPPPVEEPDPDFFDRERELAEVFRVLARGGFVAIQGESGVGKTALLEQICRMGPGRLPGWEFVYLDIGLAENEEEFLGNLSAALRLGRRGRVLAEQVRGRRFVLCLDDLNQASANLGTRNVGEVWQQMAGEGADRLRLVVASRESLPTEWLLLLPPKPSGSTGAGELTVVRLEPLAPEVARELARRCLEQAGIAVAETTLARLVAESEGYPGRLRERVAALAASWLAAAAAIQDPSLQTYEFTTVRVNRRGEVVREIPGAARYFVEDLGGVELEMVAVPGGTFLMGSPAGEGNAYERPQHEVTVEPFFLGKYPVTQAQWRAVATQGERLERDLEPLPSRFKDREDSGQRPVERVYWDDAVEFCARLSRLTGREYRLPCEAEWEYACRAGTTTPFAFGETLTADLANYDATYTFAEEPKGLCRQQTTPVGQFPPNAFGLYDLHGNVWEWCADPWHENYQGAPDKAVIWSSSDESKTGRMVRGGSWVNDPRHCRSANRRRLYRDNRYDHLGFRVACGAARTLPSSL